MDLDHYWQLVALGLGRYNDIEQQAVLAAGRKRRRRRTAYSVTLKTLRTISRSIDEAASGVVVALLNVYRRLPTQLARWCCSIANPVVAGHTEER